MNQRKSNRLKNFDYSSEGYYFITICTEDRISRFGEIIEGKMVLNSAGLVIDKWREEIKNKYKNMEIKEYVIMPNHFHAIIKIVGADLCVRPQTGGHMYLGGHIGPPLQEMIQWFKTMTTNEYIKNIRKNNWTPFNKRLWQRSFYDHVIRNEQELNRIREYIINNPLRWLLDIENLETQNFESNGRTHRSSPTMKYYKNLIEGELQNAKSNH